MQQIILSDIYSEYLLGYISRTELEGYIFKYLVDNREKTCLCHWKRDEYDDFISWFYPRLHKAIDSYKEIGSSFEAFITRFMLISSKEYRTRLATNAITEYSAWSAQVYDTYPMYAQEESPVYLNKNVDTIIKDLTIDTKGRKNTRRVLALILKCYNYISEDFAEKIAPKLGIDKNKLLDMLLQIRILRQKKDDEIYYMKERICTQFLRCLVYEKKLLINKDNADVYDKLILKHKKAKNRLDNMRKRVTSIRTEATNKQIAEIIGTTKGTVDAGLHRLKYKWKKMSNKANLN